MKYLRARPKGPALMRWYPPIVEQMQEVIRKQKAENMFLDEPDVCRIGLSVENFQVIIWMQDVYILLPNLHVRNSNFQVRRIEKATRLRERGKGPPKKGM